MSPNDYLWLPVDYLGKLFWIPLVGLGVFGMIYLYKLSAPQTKLGRYIRVVKVLAYMCLVFSPFLNGLGPYATYMLAISSTLMVYQTYQQCLAAGKIIKPTSPTAVERMADRVLQPR